MSDLTINNLARELAELQLVEGKEKCLCRRCDVSRRLILMLDEYSRMSNPAFTTLLTVLDIEEKVNRNAIQLKKDLDEFNSVVSRVFRNEKGA